MSCPTLFEQPTLDALTGMLRPDYFHHLLRERLMRQARADASPFGLFLFDIDHLQQINKRWGQSCGDSILVTVVRTMQEILPESAVVGRHGGDEFGVALPDTRLDDTFTLAEELRRRVAKIRLEEWPDVRVTCSIGVSAFPVNGHCEVELLREADEALHFAKKTGRNKVALPLADSRMITKTSYYTATQLERLAHLAKTSRCSEASLLREAVDDLLKKYDNRLAQCA